MDCQNDTEKVKVLFLPETTVRLKNLTSHTKYLVCVSAFNAAGDGPRSSPKQGRTLQAGMELFFVSQAVVMGMCMGVRLYPGDSVDIPPLQDYQKWLVLCMSGTAVLRTVTKGCPRVTSLVCSCIWSLLLGAGRQRGGLLASQPRHTARWCKPILEQLFILVSGSKMQYCEAIIVE